MVGPRSNRRNLLTALAVWHVGLWFMASAALACQFNVRDAGFVDLDGEGYRLELLAGPGVAPDLLNRIRTASAAALRDCNIALETVDAGRQTNHSTLKSLPGVLRDSDVAAVLVSPDGPSRLIRPAQPADRWLDDWPDLLSELTTSNAREQILRAVSRDFAVVLLIESSGREQNERARAVVGRALEQVKSQFARLPKPAGRPPSAVVLGTNTLVRERILLWSLGLEATLPAMPRAAVIYGRARWIGPLMQGEEITESNVAGILSIIGEDCECGLDVSWTRGTRLPVRWTEPLHAQVAKSLGFDPENPLVRIEVGRIVSRRGLGKSVRTSDPAPVPAPVDPKPTTQAARPYQSPVHRREAWRGGTRVRGWIWLGGLSFGVLAAGALIARRAAR